MRVLETEPSDSLSQLLTNPIALSFAVAMLFPNP
jgi:hypothetical protein